MIVVPHSFTARPGTWRREPAHQEQLAVFICPRGHACPLSDYEIDARGIVHPAVLCARDGCRFHEFIRLRGWRA